MTAVLSDEDCIEIVAYVSWLEDELNKSLCGSLDCVMPDEYKIYRKSFGKVIKGQF